MTCLRRFLALGLGLILGGVLTAVYYRHSIDEIADRWVLVDHTSRILADVNILKALRKGNTDYVVDVLEDELSSEIWLLAIDSHKEALSDTNSLDTLARAAAYKSKNSYTTGDAEKDRIVRALLEEATTKLRTGTSPASRAPSAEKVSKPSDNGTVHRANTAP